MTFNDAASKHLPPLGSCYLNTLSHPDPTTWTSHSTALASAFDPTSDRSSYNELDSNSENHIVSSYRENYAFELYDQGGTSRRIALGGLVLAMAFGIFCIVSGIVIASSSQWGVLKFITPHNAIAAELPNMALALIVAACTESIGFVHYKSLQSALITEHRILFNTNLRLTTAAHHGRWTNPNGTFFNVIMGILLILSYVSSSLVFLYGHAVNISNFDARTLILPPPLIILGVALTLQCMIAFAGMRKVNILTWSSSPFHTTAALLHHGQLTRKRGKCMHGVSHFRSFRGPQTPSELQPSAWQAHNSVKKVVIVLWSLAPACAIWGFIIMNVGVMKVAGLAHPEIESWSLLPNLQTSQVDIGMALLGRWRSAWLWVTVLLTMVALQGSLTMGMHCSEVVINILRDETSWRKAMGKSGVKLSSNPLTAALGNWPNVGLLISKPVLRELHHSISREQIKYAEYRLDVWPCLTLRHHNPSISIHSTLPCVSI